MHYKTHLAIGAGVAIYFLPHVVHKASFIPIVLLASVFPNLYNLTSESNSKLLGPVKWVFSHSGLVHSYTIAIVLSLAIALFYPVIALPFFLGYSFHLLADSFTKEGIRPFWPLKFESKGNVTPGGHTENAVFISFVMIDVMLLLVLVLA